MAAAARALIAAVVLAAAWALVTAGVLFSGRVLVAIAVLAGAGLFGDVPAAHAGTASAADPQTPMAAATIALLVIRLMRTPHRYLGLRRPDLKRNLRRGRCCYVNAMFGFCKALSGEPANQ